MQFANSVFREFGLLLGRAWRQASRNRPLQIVTLGQTLVIGLLLAWLYSGLEKTFKGIQDERGVSLGRRSKSWEGSGHPCQPGNLRLPSPLPADPVFHLHIYSGECLLVGAGPEQSSL